MRVVVAGGAGFIGSHLCDALIERGDEVVVIDDLSTGSKDNIAHLESHRNFNFLMADVSAEFSVSGKVNAVFNLASPASPTAYLARPLQTLAVGSEGTRRLLELALENDARFIQASTSEIYGDPLVHPQTENYWGNVNPIGPRSVYDESKRFSEALVMAHHRALIQNVGIARIFNTYGPRLAISDGRVVSNFITQALRHDPITVFGDGSQTRSLCYVIDLVAGLLRFLDTKETGPINFGNPYEIAVLELAKQIKLLTNSTSPIQYLELPIDDPRRRKPDISLAEDLLGWKPSTDTDVGLKATIPHFQSLLNRQSSSSKTI